MKRIYGGVNLNLGEEWILFPDFNLLSLVEKSFGKIGGSKGMLSQNFD